MKTDINKQLLENKELLTQYIMDQLLTLLKTKKIFKVWLSYDLGLGEDAEKLTHKEYRDAYNKKYQPFLDWLNKHDAVECGESVAVFDAMEKDVSHLIKAFKNELARAGISDSNARIYIVVSDFLYLKNKQGVEFGEEKICYSGFIIGERKKAAWEEKPKRKYSNIDIPKN